MHLTFPKFSAYSFTYFRVGTAIAIFAKIDNRYRYFFTIFPNSGGNLNLLKLTKFCFFTASGLQLFVGPDGSVSFDKRSSRKNYEQVVFDGSRR